MFDFKFLNEFILTQNRFQRPTTILLSSNRSRTQRYESRGVQRPHSLPSSSQRHRSLRYSQSASPANPPQSSLTHLRVHHSSSSNRNNPNNTPPPASDSSDHNDNESNIFNNSSIISSLHRQINIPNIPSTSSRLPRPARPSQHSSSNDNERRSQHQHPRPRIYPNISSQIHRSVQAQFSPPPSNHAPNLLLDTGNLLASRGVNEEQDNNEVRGDFEYGDLSVLNPSIFASRSSSPLSSQLIEHLSMTNHASSQTQSVDDNNSGNNNNKETDAAAALVKLSKSGDSKMSSKDDDNKEDKSDNHNRNKGDNKENDDDSKMNDKSKSKMELDNDDGIDAKSSKLINTPQSQTKLNMSSIYIDWENESDSSEDEERYFTKKDKDMVKNEERRLKISTKMSDDFKIPEGYMAHSIFVCPISSDYAPDPQARLSCGHLVSCSAFAKLQTIKRSRQHEANRNRGINIHCPICDTPCDSEKDVRFVYLGRFPNLKVDSRFSDILEKELDAQARKWIPGNSIAAKE